MANFHNNNSTSLRQKFVDMGVKTNTFLLSRLDKIEMEKVIKEQVCLLGGNKWLYRRINRNLKDGYFDPYFIREHCKLYKWREEYFDAKFPGNSWFTVDEEQYDDDLFSWDDPFTRFITIPVQLAQNFDAVVAMATANVEENLLWLKSNVYFSNDEIISNEVESKFKLESMISDLTDSDVGPNGLVQLDALMDNDHTLREHYDQVDLTFSDIAHIIVEVYQRGPKKLEELAIKAVITNRILPTKLSPMFQRKFVSGMYTIDDDVPENITNEGKLIYNKIRKAFSDSNN